MSKSKTRVLSTCRCFTLLKLHQDSVILKDDWGPLANVVLCCCDINPDCKTRKLRVILFIPHFLVLMLCLQVGYHFSEFRSFLQLLEANTGISKDTPRSPPPNNL